MKERAQDTKTETRQKEKRHGQRDKDKEKRLWLELRLGFFDYNDKQKNGSFKQTKIKHPNL